MAVAERFAFYSATWSEGQNLLYSQASTTSERRFAPAGPMMTWSRLSGAWASDSGGYGRESRGTRVMRGRTRLPFFCCHRFRDWRIAGFVAVESGHLALAGPVKSGANVN